MTYRPSEVYLQTIAETEAGSIVGTRIKQLEKDFIESVEELPRHKSRITNMPESARQGLVDFAFAFFMAGVASALDKQSNFNLDKSELEFRRDLN